VIDLEIPLVTRLVCAPRHHGYLAPQSSSSYQGTTGHFPSDFPLHSGKTADKNYKSGDELLEL
jgi:hypothetical protein